VEIFPGQDKGLTPNLGLKGPSKGKSLRSRLGSLGTPRPRGLSQRENPH